MEIAKDSARFKLTVMLAALLMAISAVALVPADMSDADGDEIMVSTWGELKDAISSASVDAVIALANDITDESDSPAIQIKEKFLYIDLKGHKIDRCGFKGDDDDRRLFDISGASKVYISNGTLTGGRAEDGGCVYIKGGSNIQLDDVIVTDNYSDGDGGAIYLKYALVMMNGGKITDNSCDGDGGAIYLENEAWAVITGTEISGNHADDGDGGVLYSDHSDYGFVRCAFEDNYCDGDGGVVFAEGMTDETDLTYFTDCSFSENYTKKDDDNDGGAIYLEESHLGIIRCTFEGNHCGFDGGAIYAENSTIDYLSDTVFRNNSAPDSGGAVRLYGGNCYLGDVVFEGNYANNCGGGLYMNNGANVVIKGIRMTGNSARLDGGGLLVGADGDNTVEIQGLIVINDNTANRDGNNVFLREGQVLKCSMFDGGSSIGIKLAKASKKFTENFGNNNPGVDPAKIFFSDDPDYYVALDPDSGEAKMFKEGTSGEMSNDINIWIIVGVIVAVVMIGAAVYFFVVRKP